MTGQPLSSLATKCIVLLHGWNPGGAPNCYDSNNGYEFYELINDLKIKLMNSGWSIVAYDWHQDASTGYIGQDWSNPVIGAANQAAANAELHGDHLATMLDNTAPDLREVHFIAHSAGSHAARKAMTQLLQLNHYAIIQVTLLDPYIPCPNDSLGAFSDLEFDQLPFWNGGDRIIRLENYFADDSPTHGWNAYPWGSYYPPTINTQERFYWRTGIDINQEVNWGSVLVNQPVPGTHVENYDWHSGPIQFYADTVDAAIPTHSPSTSLPTGTPYDYRQIGWNRSLYAWEAFLPQIVSQPADQTVQSGSMVTLTVSANRADTIDWYVFGGNWIGSGSTITLNNFTAANPRVYVARVGNNSGELFTRPVTITVNAPIGPLITSVSPSTFTGLPLTQTTLIRVIGSGFTTSSRLTFNDGFTSYPNRVPVFVSANELDYNVSTGTSQANWTVQVVNGAQVSNLGRFTVNAPSSPPTTTGSLIVNLSPAGSISAGAQWQVDGTGYNGSGQVVGYLTPGSHTLSFKPVSGYTTPGNQSVTITANTQTTASGTYSAVAPSTYSLTLNQGGSLGYIAAQPIGAGNGSVYNAGAVVQLSANANFGYHFVSWGGDASGSGSQNPTTITMNGNKIVSANFSAGDPNLGTITVTITPPEAAAAGVTWGFNDNDFRASGTSYSYYPETVWVELHNTNGWVGYGGWVTFTAGFVSNYTFAASSTNGTIIGTDPRTYFTLAGSAGVQGSADGTNSSASFSSIVSLAVDTGGNIFVADNSNSNIRKVTPGGKVTTFAGQLGVTGYADGQGTNAIFNNIQGIGIDRSNNVYVADMMNSVIRKITPDGIVSTFAGQAGNNGSVDATGSAARFYFPVGIAVDTNGNIYVSDSVNQTIRKITPGAAVTTLAGSPHNFGYANGTGSAALFHNPEGIAVDAVGNVYVADEVNEVIRKVTPSGVVTTLAGFPGSAGAADGTGSAARFQFLSNLALDRSGNVYVADPGNNAVRMVTSAGVVTTLAGQSGSPGSTDGIGSVARFRSPFAVAVDASGNLYVADSGNRTIRATQPLTTKTDQFISFTPIPDKSASDAPFPISATSSSGLSVFLNVLSGPAVLDTNNVVTLLGGGLVNVVAWQPGNSNYNAAAPILRTFNVNRIPQAITFGPLSQQKAGDAPFSLSASADSGLPVSFSVSGSARLDGNILTLTGWGTVTVTASQPGNVSYFPATNVVQSFFVVPLDKTIVGPQKLTNGNFQLAFYGLTGSNYLIQTSTNLVNWQPFTNFSGSNALIYLIDPAATNYSRRFYRAVIQ